MIIDLSLDLTKQKVRGGANFARRVERDKPMNFMLFTVDGFHLKLMF